MASASGNLVIKRYEAFKGVDFNDKNTVPFRSPDALNMWRDYRTLGRCVETRPDLELQLSFSNTIYGLFFYTINKVEHWIIHSGTSLIDYNAKTKVKKTIKANGMNPKKSTAFIYNNQFFLIDGLNYLEYDGETLKDVEGTIPLTTIARKPGSIGGGTQYQYVNLLSDYRKNGFWGDGESKDYYLDSQNIASGEVKVWINDVLQTSDKYTVDSINGVITFQTAPEKADNEDNVVIQYKKEVSGYKNRIKNCTLATQFDNRVFFSGNIDYPNTIFWCSYNDPRYIGDSQWSMEGTDVALIKAMVPGNNALWVFKEPSQSNTTVFYHTPIETTDTQVGTTVKAYPSSHSTISTGCVSTGINFNDDIVFFSDRGMEGITGDITTQQFLGHRSSLVDSRLLNEDKYTDLSLVKWEGYLLVIVDNKVYLADSRQKLQNGSSIEYEWFYWELPKAIRTATVHNNDLYLCSQEEIIKDNKGYEKYTNGTNIYWYDSINDKLYDSDYKESTIKVNTLTAVIDAGIYTLTNKQDDRQVKSYWTTNEEDYGYPQMLKQTNKRGFKSDVSGDEIKISVKTDNKEYEDIGTFENTKGYIVTKLKRKKWNKIQLKYSADKPFGIYHITLESYVGSYVKRS